MLSIENLTVAFGGFTLLDRLNFVIDRKDRTALVGKNGAGKSTLLKIIAGRQEATSGRASMPKNTTIGYLPQQILTTDQRSVRQEAALAFAEILLLESKLEAKICELNERKDVESDSYLQLIEEISMLNERLAMEGAGSREAEIERVLTGLGFVQTDLDRPTSHFSGGWRMRIELAKILLQRPDILLLDEPTNHLDIESIQWLEGFLLSAGGAVILVSHDRAFLDNVTQRTIEISLGKIYDYRVPYSKYVKLREERREQQLRAYENQRKQIDDTEDFIERFRYKASKAVQVQSRIKQLDKLERLAVDEEDRSSLRLKFPPAPRSGSYPVIAENLSKSYDDHLVFGGATFTIHRGDKVAFVGRNGEGKSTLVKCILNEVDYGGKLTLGHQVKIGYFAQNQATLMDESRTVFQTVDDVAVGDVRTKIRDILGAFMFGGEAADKKVGVLSGGERTRLAMIRLLLEPVNLLILDEPTNHLDMRSKDVLKEALIDFEGTLIVVSHDRDFLNGLVGKVYEFNNKQITEHLGGIYDFLEKKKIGRLQELEWGRKTAVSRVQSAPVAASPQSHEAAKAQQRAKRRLEKQISDCERIIEDLESEIKAIETRLTTPDGAADVDLLRKYADRQKKLAAAMDEWSAAGLDLQNQTNTI
jgi:ATP-binding cassette subfamily F protein 3